jgi:hypothetical protein
MLNRHLFEYAIDYPAWALGTLIGGTIYIALAAGGVIGGICLGVLAYQAVRIPLLNWIAGIIIAVWSMLVAARSITWTGAGIFSALEHRDDE